MIFLPTYTTLLQSPFDQISPEDENFIEELLAVAQLFQLFLKDWTRFSRCISGFPGISKEKYGIEVDNGGDPAV